MLLGFEDGRSQAMKLGLFIHGPIVSPGNSATIPGKSVTFVSREL